MPDVRFAIRCGLNERRGTYEVYEAGNGKEAIDCLQRIKPDVILMDIMMPGMDGAKASFIIKNNPESKDIPLIFMSAKESKKLAGKKKFIADAFLPKPFEIYELIGVMDRLIEGKR